MVVAYYPYFQGVQNYKALDFAVLLGLLGAVVGWRKGSPETRALALTALAFVPAVMIQAKGWSYQSIPVRGFLFLAIVAELMRERKNPFADSILFGAALLSFWPVGIYENERIPEASEHLKDLKPGTSVIALASNPSFAWPTVETYHLKWASKQFSYWQMSAVMKTKDRNYVPNVRRVIQADLARKPDIVIADRRPYVTWVFDAAIPSLPGYRLRRHTKWIDSYERVQ